MKHFFSRGLYALFFLIALFFVTGCSSGDGPIDLDNEEYRTWDTYHGDKGNTHYSSLKQINVDNVHKLREAWVFSTGDGAPRGEMQANGIVIDGLYYGTTPLLKVFAIKANTGDLVWMFDPFKGVDLGRLGAQGRHRGVTYWTDGAGDKRIITIAGSRIFALNATNGELIQGFGENGSVDFKKGKDVIKEDGDRRDVSDMLIHATTPGIIYKDMYITGSRIPTIKNSAPGSIRAYDVRTGELKWQFNTIPGPGEYGYDTWPPDAWRHMGGANSWAGLSVDEKRGIVYGGTGAASMDFYGGDRHGDNLFSNTLLALDANTGKRVWHYQIVRHDVWDWDVPAPPNLITVKHDGKWIDAVAQITKHGYIYVLDRETGKPLFPMTEVEVPPSSIPEEKLSLTQPVPLKPAPIMRTQFREEDINDIFPEARDSILAKYRTLKRGNMWNSPSLEGTLFFPGTSGGMNKGGAAFDPETGIMYVNSTEQAFIVTLKKLNGTGSEQMAPGMRAYATNCGVCHGADRTGNVTESVPSLINIQKRYKVDELLSIIDHGKGNMPAFAHLSREQKDAIISFITGKENSVVKSDKSINMEVPDESQAPYSFDAYKSWEHNGYPTIKPPWGTLNAIDMNTGEYVWTVPLGEFPELKAKGVPQTGTENSGGPVVTAGGLIFIAATKDQKFRAFNKKNGELLWETDLPVNSYATPSVYEIDGKQYVVVAAGGGRFGTKSGNTYHAYALPEE
jgi:quinoprotein glucose dehydrogenase